MEELEQKNRDLELITKIINNVQTYAQREIENYTESIKDYIDDDKIANKDIIDNLKEDREHWKDILRICNNNKKLYINLEEIKNGKS